MGHLVRKITFERTDLQPHRQMIYDRSGAVATEAVYGDFQKFGEIMFPSQIMINRPKEEYSLTLTIEKLEINKPLTDEQFVLTEPTGALVKTLK
jgi:hypothetical protein